MLTTLSNAYVDNGQKAQWEALEVAVRGASIEASIRRARLQAAAADARFRHTLSRSLLPASSSRPKVRSSSLFSLASATLHIPVVQD